MTEHQIALSEVVQRWRQAQDAVDAAFSEYVAAHPDAERRLFMETGVAPAERQKLHEAMRERRAAHDALYEAAATP